MKFFKDICAVILTLVMIYIGFMTYCVLCMSDGCPPGSLFYFLKMDKVLEYILRGYVFLRGAFAA